MLAPEILLVEPDDTLAALLLEVLGEAGYQVERVRSGNRALAHCAARADASYRLVIVSSDLPAMEAADSWLARLRGWTSAVLVRVPWQDQHRANDAATLREPFAPDDILNAVSALLRPAASDGAATDAAMGRPAQEAHGSDGRAATCPDEAPDMDPFEVSHLRARAALDQLDAALLDCETHGNLLAEQSLVLEALHNGAFILCPPSCGQDGCAVALFELQGRDYIRVCYGAEQGDLAVIAAGAGAGLSCPHCGVRPGQWHHVGCFFELCPLCGKSLLDGCHGDHAAPEADLVAPGMTDLALCAPRLRGPKPIDLARRFHTISPHIRHVHERTGVNVRSSVQALMTATSTIQMRETLHHIDCAELAALRLLYRMIR